MNTSCLVESVDLSTHTRSSTAPHPWSKWSACRRRTAVCQHLALGNVRHARCPCSAAFLGGQTWMGD
eukprot:1156186-Pelagomonas_calceolata.AAC.2